MAKLNGSLPKGHGLGPAVRRLAEGQPVVALVVLRRFRRVEDYEKDETELIVKISEIEAIRRGDLFLAQDLMRRALEDRTGQPTLPYDLEKALEGVFEGLDLDVPEVAENGQEPLPVADLPKPEIPAVCDHCGKPVDRDSDGWWSTADKSTDCTKNETAPVHEVGGES